MNSASWIDVVKFEQNGFSDAAMPSFTAGECGRLLKQCFIRSHAGIKDKLFDSLNGKNFGAGDHRLAA